MRILRNGFMGAEGKRRRKFIIRKKQARHTKLQKFARKFAEAKSLGEKKKIEERIGKLAPNIDVEEYTKAARK